MTTRIAINGFGRIGRNILRASWGREDIQIAHINDLTSLDMLAYLLKYDTVHGTFDVDIDVDTAGQNLIIDGVTIPCTAERDPAALPWAERQIDVVMECTGVFTNGKKAAAHIAAGAKKVLISAPGTDVDGTYVFGVNHQDYDAASQTVVSNASCTTNCLAPVAKVLDDLVGIESGTMTTVHSYTMDQNLLDAPHRKGKFRRARAAAENIVPTSTGAAKAIGLVLPQLAGKLDGMAIRVPTPNTSLIDLVFIAGRDTSAEEINAALAAAAEGPMKGVLAVTDEPVVSSDIVGVAASSLVDLGCTKVTGARLVKVLSWYDNEWGFSNRMIDHALHLVS